MSYTKTQWVNNTTPIDETNLNKIEQGIYDNSLVTDAITNTINPTDTETYKTAELTEGQITDVIGVNDIVIKGQTSQNGEPTPSSPVDVNVVSGSNVINTSSKNLMDKNSEISQGSTNNSADTTRVSIRVKHKLKANTTYTVITNLNTSNFNWAFVFGTKVSPWSNAEQLYDSGWKNTNHWSYTTSQECYISIPIKNSSSTNININDVKDYWFMLYEGAYDSNVPYEQHQGKELPLDLPVENLFDESLITSTSSSIKYIPIQCQANTDYTLSTNNVASPTNTNLFLSTQDSGVTGANNGAYINSPRTINSGNNTTIYVGYRNDLSNNWIQLEKGSSASPYHPYGTDPIELCKIGDYQDYFYKSGSKWYLHKEIEKMILGDYNWTLANNTSISNINTNRWYISHPCSRLPNNNTKVIMSNILPMGTANSTYGQDELLIGQSTSQTVIRMPVEYTSASAIKTALQNLSAYAYVLKNEVTDTEITDTILISQLEAIYNAPLYEQTNITQENNDLPMVLDITACKDNINGIKAFIRK